MLSDASAGPRSTISVCTRHHSLELISFDGRGRATRLADVLARRVSSGVELRFPGGANVKTGLCLSSGQGVISMYLGCPGR